VYALGGAFILGFTMGLSAFIPPGPVLVLLIQQSLSRGFRAGLSITFASAVVGLGILALILGSGVSRLFGSPDFQFYMVITGGVSMALLGALIGVRSLSPVGSGEPGPAGSFCSSPFVGGLLVNALNPLAYLWWVLIGIPGLGIATDLAGPGGMYAWSGGILGALVLWYGGLSFTISRGKGRVPAKAIQMVSFLSGVLLVIFGIYLCIRFL
jgi:threonine/homoserine/homoserine lactone efflux protein